MKFEIEKFMTDEKLRAVLVNGSIYTGGSSGCLVNRSTNSTLYRFEKSITSIAAYNDYLGCSSYDCRAVIFKNDTLEDVIEGPDTEIKCISINDGFIALSTRGKNVWICKFDNSFFDLDKILEDHSEDVKGCKFYNDYLFTYGYDTTIKIYEYFDYTGGYELIQDITTYHTVWDLIIINKSMFIACDNGEIIKYDLDKGWVEVNRRQLGLSPLYTLCQYKNLITTGVNGGNLVFLDLDLNVIEVIEGLHDGDINCISYNNNNLYDKDLLVTCSDDQNYCVLREEQ